MSLRHAPSIVLLQSLPTDDVLRELASGERNLYRRQQGKTLSLSAPRQYLHIDVDRFDADAIATDYNMLERQHRIAEDIQAMLDVLWPDED
jgi:hypothetical protein